MIYLLEDDESIRKLLCYSLDKTGLAAKGFEAPSSFFAALREELPELVLLDFMLPEEDGLSVLKKLRSSSELRGIPVIMLTAKGSEFDKVSCLDAGADDYVVKPFGVMELLARIRALLRRSGMAKSEVVHSCGCVSVYVDKRRVCVSGEDVPLTYKEFELLCYLFENRGIVLTRDKILSEVWGYDFDGENRTVDVHIRTLRQKLGNGADIVQTVRGVGYRISEGEIV